MDKLNNTDIPAIVGDGTGSTGVLMTIALVLGLFSIGFFGWALLRMGEKNARAKVGTLLASIGTTGVLLGLTFLAGNHHEALYYDHLNGYREASAKIADQNSETTADWINSNYEVEVDQKDAAKLLGTDGKYVQSETERKHFWESNGITYSDLETDEIQSIAEPAYVKSDAGEVLNVQIVWDGDSYVLLREGGGEVAQRTS